MPWKPSGKPLPQCTFPGCREDVRSRNTRRCNWHAGIHVKLPRGPRQLRRRATARWWCTPCHRWVYDLVHTPAPRPEHVVVAG